MTPTPFYTSNHVQPAYQLRYTWTGWPKRNSRFPDKPPPSFFETIAKLWDSDGLRLLDVQWSPNKIALLVSTKPMVFPTFLAKRLKGRLQHGLRQAETPTSFSRKFSVTSVGHTRRTEVESYVKRQVDTSNYASTQFKTRLKAFTSALPSADLSKPSSTRSGRYWYNIHLVLVVDGRVRIGDSNWLQNLYRATLCIAEAKDDRISTLSVMPDHLHLTLRGNIDRSPQDIALSYMNNLGYMLRIKALWQPSYYVGTFGEYDMNALSCRTSS